MNTPTPIHPPALKKGDKIGVIAPSSRYDTVQLRPAVDFLTSKGFEVVFHPQTSEKYGQFAGTPDQKVGALHDYFKDPSIKAIFCTCGGNGSLHLLDKIDHNLIKSTPKILMGYSDITALLNAISSQTGLVTFHGPTLSRLNKIETQWLDQMMALLTGKESLISVSGDIHTEGKLFGGNLSVLQGLIGTPYAPNLQNAILMLEDTNDHLSRYDRMIAHMKQAGWLENLSAIICGEFLKSQDNKDRPFGFTMEDIIKNSAPNTPTLMDAPFGHGDKLCTLPIGAKCILKNGQLSFKSL